MKRVCIWFALLCSAAPVLACSPETGTSIPPGSVPGKADLFGTDDRLEIYDFPVSHLYRRTARSVAAVVLFGDATERPAPTDDRLVLAASVDSYGNTYELCDSERFFEQPSVLACTGFLVAPDIMVTAGHCLGARTGIAAVEQYCDGLTVLFDYAYDAPPADPFVNIPLTTDSLFSCSEVLAADHGGSESDDHDYAVIRLDRQAVGRTPLPYARTEDAIQPGMTAFVLGHPSGLPMKATPNATVQAIVDRRFESDADTFQGNSGSPVLDDAGTVIGIHSTRASGNHFKESPDDPSCQVAVNCTTDPDECFRHDGFPRHYRIAEMADVLDALIAP